jgi:hypothetical protein
MLPVLTLTFRSPSGFRNVMPVMVLHVCLTLPASGWDPYKELERLARQNPRKGSSISIKGLLLRCPTHLPGDFPKTKMSSTPLCQAYVRILFPTNPSKNIFLSFKKFWKMRM